ncbi:MAG: hypothetical protein WC783_03085 [Candidatus Paceibacterota bacterium]|jgi:glucose-6-phosphate 1-dehydrogenase
MNSEYKNLTFVLFGARGDLSKRYLLPALKNLGINPILISRNDYPNLNKIIPKGGEIIFHLAIPPEGVFDAIKLISENFRKENIKILLEKPFGKDLESAKNLALQIDEYFDPLQIYRVDHYLTKKSLQNLNGPKENIKALEIIASEKLDIEGRANFYEQTGALRDFVQSHMLEMTAIALAGSFDLQKRYEVLKALSVVCDISKNECVKRGQYEGYREEVGNPRSTTETFVSINLVMGDIAITLTTGKALNEKNTQIIFKYKNGGEEIFNIEHEIGAYEKVIEAAIKCEHNFFISEEEVLETWRILDSIQQSWKDSTKDLVIYPKGSTITDVLRDSREN